MGSPGLAWCYSQELSLFISIITLDNYSTRSPLESKLLVYQAYLDLSFSLERRNDVSSNNNHRINPQRN